VHYACGDTLRQTEESPTERERERERDMTTPQHPLLAVTELAEKGFPLEQKQSRF